MARRMVGVRDPASDPGGLPEFPAVYDLAALATAIAPALQAFTAPGLITTRLDGLITTRLDGLIATRFDDNETLLVAAPAMPEEAIPNASTAATTVISLRIVVTRSVWVDFT